MEKEMITWEPFILMDKLDDELIKQEILGRLPEALVYHFTHKGQEIWGLSKIGVDTCKQELAKKGEVIREIEAKFEETSKNYYFSVKAGRYVISKDGKEVLLDVAIGFKRQARFFKDGREDPFAFECAGIKAARNACLRLIPQSIKQGVIEWAKKQQKVQEIRKPPQEKK